MNPEDVYFARQGVVTVSWDPESSAAHLETEGGWADSAEFQAASEAVIACLREHRASRLLGNGRNLKVVKQADQDWMSRDWMPRALAAGLRRMALVIPKSALARTNLEQMVGRAADTKLEVAYVETVEQARTWLNLSPVPRTSNAVAALDAG